MFLDLMFIFLVKSVPPAQPRIAKNIMMMPFRYSGMARSCNPSQKMSKIPLKQMITPNNDLKLNFCKPKNKLPIKTKIGEQALIKAAKLLLNSSSATVVSPFAMTNIKTEKIIWKPKFFQPIHFSSLRNNKIVSIINPAKN